MVPTLSLQLVDDRAVNINTQLLLSLYSNTITKFYSYLKNAHDSIVLKFCMYLYDLILSCLNHSP